MSNYPVGAEHLPHAPFNEPVREKEPTEAEILEEKLDQAYWDFKNTIEKMKTEASPNDLERLNKLDNAFDVIDEELKKYV